MSQLSGRSRYASNRDTWERRLLMIAAFAAGMWTANAAAQEAQWIWSPQHTVNQVPETACYFRKTISVLRPEQGQVSVIADDAYELFVNGRRVGGGESNDRMQEHAIGRFLSRGRNIIAIKAVNRKGSTAGVAARVMIKEQEGQWQTFSTDSTWKANLRPLPFWNTALYNDSRWSGAVELGRLGETAPWDVRENVAQTPAPEVRTERFKVGQDFVVEQILKGDEVGSLIAVTFNEFGHLLVSREGGPLLLIYDSDEDGQLDAVREYCTAVKNCQGILALNGHVFVTAGGPEGAGLYRLQDEDRDGMLEKVTLLLPLGESMGEHGAHGLTLGPDGLIYLVVGNQAALPQNLNSSSPYQNYYEGDLVGPRYEDPSGHAAGKTAPGGAIVRTDLRGKSVELVAGGLRNAYDLAFDRQGNLFVHDSDMESDQGMTWYRPTRLYHITPGAEFGWRSGWAKWPDYYVDVLPGILDTGRGSPSGAVCYQHFAFPTRYHGALFLADWSEGRILAVSLRQSGASFSASSEVFLEGRPLNVTDLEVGPDGALYFVTGGRGTEGGIYRARWSGQVPEAVQDLGRGMSVAIRQPQMNSAWSRQKIAEIRQSLGDAWGEQLRGVARSSANPWHYRIRALDLMTLFGPPPTAELLIRLSRDGNESVRQKAVESMGLYASDETRERLVALLADSDRGVRRRACESLLRSGATPPLNALIPALASDDRHEAWAARRLLERMPLEQWRDTLLENQNHRLVIQGGLALMVAHPSTDHALLVADRFEQMLEDFITDRDFVNLLRLTQVALHRSELQYENVPTLSEKLGDEFPSSDDAMNRELIRLLAYLHVDRPMDRYLAFLRSEAANIEKLHLALHLRFLEQGWSMPQRLQLIAFYETAKTWGGGSSYEDYIALVERDFGKMVSPEEGLDVLVGGKQWPEAAVGVLYNLPTELDDQTVETLINLDQSLMSADPDATNPLRIGILAILARSGKTEGFDYLRYVWDNEPERRETVAVGLAQHPGDPNWPYLVKSLSILEEEAAREVMRRLATVNQVPDDAEPIRQTILLGLKLKEQGSDEALALLEHWTGYATSDPEAPPAQQLKGWQKWFAERYPDKTPAALPVAKPDSKWNFDELYEHLTNDQGSSGSPIQGALVFEKAECIKCHRFGNRGEALGPDLTSLRKRFMKKEVLEAILYPSHVVSDQYAATTIVLNSGRILNGMVTRTSNGDLVALLATGEKTTIPSEDVETTTGSSASIMPDNLLDNLTLREISDLFAYLGMAGSENVARVQERTQAR